tara:strand:- start:71 stop:784 length:714 start_codon:yes stop_codon:yes gene_type:complete
MAEFTARPILEVIASAVGLVIMCEGYAWYSVYRHEAYRKAIITLKRLKAEKDKLEAKEKEIATSSKANKKIGKSTTPLVVKSKGKGTSTKAKVAADSYNNSLAGLTALSSRSTMVTTVVNFACMQFLRSRYKGVVIAVLPFTPFTLLQKLTQKGLELECHPRACGFLFIWLVLQVGLRPFVKKLVGPKPVEGTGYTAFLKSPQIIKMMEKWGVDPKALEDFTSGNWTEEEAPKSKNE